MEFLELQKDYAKSAGEVFDEGYGKTIQLSSLSEKQLVVVSF